MRLQTLVAMAPHILVLEAAGFHKQLVVVVIEMAVVGGSHMELEVEAMVMVVVANCNELVVVANCNELEVVVEVNGKLVGEQKLLVEVVVMATAGAYNVLAVEVGANILHTVGVEGEVVLYKVVGMEVVVNGLAEVAGEVRMDK